MNAPVVSLRDVSVGLGGLPIVRGITADIRPGEFVALLGANGSGKTTLLRAVLGLVPHHRGSIELFGEPLDSFRDWRRVGYVPQHIDPAMLNSTVREVVGTGRLPLRRPFVPPGRRDREAIARALAEVDLADRARTRISHLSGGQRRRTMIARALATDPELLVMDEPLAGVDLATQETLAGLMRTLTQARGLTVLVVLHEPGPFADLVSRTLLLQDGRLVYDGAGFELALPHEHHLPPEHVSSQTDWVPSYPTSQDQPEED
ncbi:zinc transport system ATP-binding protein [Raineyella antarctica]|uniref:Zinc transport system ATP-binding protein n=1 Tax=Raineyella antarctica TaxID=1577474 RepID=A0A1G6GX67_9ACTN|nr:ABC transporter ATP-binding protein [Raineyella antarctica]SDB86488.1 zinc transport system ATP-binding protein [Raineyella antarctica]